MHINQVITNVETNFNVAGSTPVVGIFSGMARAAVGYYQAITGAALAAIGFVGKLFGDKAKYTQLANRGVEHLIHGMLNNLRGFGEFLLGLTIFGSIGLGAVQYSIRGKNSELHPFRPLVAYQETKAAPGDVVINNVA